MEKTLLIAGLLVAASTAQAQTPYYYQYGPRYGALPADGTTEGLPAMNQTQTQTRQGQGQGQGQGQQNRYQHQYKNQYGGGMGGGTGEQRRMGGGGQR
jgi:hypothetical protein